MGRKVGLLVDSILVEIQVLDTDLFYGINEYKDALSFCTNVERKSYGMEQHNVVSKLANRNAGKLVLMNRELEMWAIYQSSLRADGIHIDNTKGHTWMNRVFQERLGLDELEMKLFNTGVLGAEEAANVRAMHLGSVQATAQALRGAHDQEQIQDGME